MISRILLSLGLVFVLGSAITQVRGSQDEQLPVTTIHGAGDVTRGKTGSFVLGMEPIDDVRWNLRELLCQRHRYPRS